MNKHGAALIIPKSIFINSLGKGHRNPHQWLTAVFDNDTSKGVMVQRKKSESVMDKATTVNMPNLPR